MASAAAHTEGIASSTRSGAVSAYTFSVPTPGGKNVSFAEAAGDARVVLAVNVASQCGLTNSNYEGLQELQEQFAGQPFTVLGFPANDFGGQEPGS
jgi:glutathione peroxidase